MDEGDKSMFMRSLLDDRLREVLRLRSAQINACGPCSMSRKEDNVSEDDVVCLADPDAANYTRRERLALKFLTLMYTDHYALTPETYRELGEVFTSAEIVELGWTCAQTMGGHSFMHRLDLLGQAEAVITRT